MLWHFKIDITRRKRFQNHCFMNLLMKIEKNLIANYKHLWCTVIYSDTNSDHLKDGAEFEVIGDPEELKKEQEEQARVQGEKVSAEEGTSEAAKTKPSPLLQSATCKFSCIIPVTQHQS